MTGQGTYWYSNGDRFLGEWYDGRMHGNGILYIAGTGSFFDCVWEQGQPLRGVWINAENHVYEGTFQNRQPHGKGVYSWPSGRSREGSFRNGALDQASAKLLANYAPKWTPPPQFFTCVPKSNPIIPNGLRNPQPINRPNIVAGQASSPAPTPAPQAPKPAPVVAQPKPAPAPAPAPPPPAPKPVEVRRDPSPPPPPRKASDPPAPVTTTTTIDINDILSGLDSPSESNSAPPPPPPPAPPVASTPPPPPPAPPVSNNSNFEETTEEPADTFKMTSNEIEDILGNLDIGLSSDPEPTPPPAELESETVSLDLNFDLSPPPAENNTEELSTFDDLNLDDLLTGLNQPEPQQSGGGSIDDLLDDLMSIKLDKNDDF
eukprot:TRINITY_DN602_c0_g1_i3.p1 TRINITY_DN602_c0_g1~~TRINITY_DN602_c0_g1_i3.p1  ORF type:complete len:374 (+),score=157.95 TRINITY_DN602_c0_g1_i3:172-1293(+)